MRREAPRLWVAIIAKIAYLAISGFYCGGAVGGELGGEVV